MLFKSKAPNIIVRLPHQLNLKTGFHYILKINDGFVTIDSDEH